MTESTLTPRQKMVLSDLLDPGGDRPSFDDDVVKDVKRALDDSLSDLDEKILGKGMTISKSMLYQVLACEGYYDADADNFEWSVPTATGTVAHKAIELSSSLRHDYTPGQLVDLAFERLCDPNALGTPREWLNEIDEAERAELKVAAVDRVAKFQDTFPPLDHKWLPRVETSLKFEALNGALLLRGKPDLALGRASGNTARVLLIDFKTGKSGSYHLDDLRFYALLEAARANVPPFRVATFYLDSGTWLAEDVNEDTLYSAVRRVSEGIHKIVELRNGSREAELTPGPVCRYCSARNECPKASWIDSGDELEY